MDHLVPARIATALREAGLRAAGPLSGAGGPPRWTALAPDGTRWSVTEVPADRAHEARRRAARLAEVHDPYLAQAGPVLDLPGGDVAVLVAADPGTALEVLLAARDPLDDAEAAGVLQPLAGALAALHAAGLAHGALGGADVVLTEAGPVLVDAGVVGEPALLAQRQTDDVLALARIGRRLTGGADGLVDRICRSPGPDAVTLAARLAEVPGARLPTMPDSAVLAALALRRLAGLPAEPTPAGSGRRGVHRARPRRRVSPDRRGRRSGSRWAARPRVSVPVLATLLVAAVVVTVLVVSVLVVTVLAPAVLPGPGLPAVTGAARAVGGEAAELGAAARAAVRLTEQRVTAQAAGDLAALAGGTEPGSPAARADAGWDGAPVDLAEVRAVAGAAARCQQVLVCVPVTTTIRVEGEQAVTATVTLALRPGTWQVVSVSG